MATIKTVADPRIVDEQGIVMNQYVGPANWEHYKIPASGLSNTQITFANLVTLGTNRLYDSNFEIEYTLSIKLPNNVGATYDTDRVLRRLRMVGFPLSSVSDQIRCNINGSACVSRPQESLPQRMMYWNQKVIDKTCSYCPHQKPTIAADQEFMYQLTSANGQVSTYMEEHVLKFMTCQKGSGGQIGKTFPCVNASFDPTTHILLLTLREPILCPPFNQRLDKLYQRPLFNITSIDIVYQLNDLRRMFEMWNYVLMVPRNAADEAGHTIDFDTHVYDACVPSSFVVNITNAQLCFNVASMPNGSTVPASLTMPYYDNVNYVTSYTGSEYGESQPLTSGVYTLAQVPTAIYIFVSEDQLFRSNGANDYSINFCPIRDINITMGNNTQILNTTSEIDRYRMCLANGLQDTTWEDFHRPCQYIDKAEYAPAVTTRQFLRRGGKGCRCVLRLIPGVDILIPERRLVGGMDADQMVFQVRVNADMSALPPSSQGHMALWIMFEYCGTLTIEPVHSTIDMIPIKSMPALSGIDGVADSTVSPEGDLPSAVPGSGTPEGGGIFSNIWNAIKGLPNLVSRGLRTVSNWMSSPQANAARGIVSSFLGQGDSSSDSGWAQQGARWLGDTIRNRTSSMDMNDEPPVKVTKGGTIIGSGTLGKFYT